MLEVDNLSTRSTSGPQLQNISFTLTDGKVLMLLGANGSGKSQVLQALAGALDFTGRIRVHHYNLASESLRVKTQIGYLASPATIEPYLTGYEYLELIGAFYNLAPKIRRQRIFELADRFQFRDFIFQPLERIGEANRLRVGLIASVIHHPRLVLWDEPLLHLDHHGRGVVNGILDELLQTGTAAVVATNGLSWAEATGDRFLILKRGEMVSEGTLTQLNNHAQAKGKHLEDAYLRLSGE